MTDEQFENRMEFIVEQQAKFATDLQRLTDDLQQLTDNVHGLTKAQERTDGMLCNLAEVNLALTTHLQETDERLIRLAQQTDERLNRLAEAQERSTERVDTLIDVVDKLVRRNGGGNPEA